jgi:hypothetical protein
MMRYTFMALIAALLSAGDMVANASALRSGHSRRMARHWWASRGHSQHMQQSWAWQSTPGECAQHAEAHPTAGPVSGRAASSAMMRFAAAV